MGIDKKLLDILCDPVTKVPVTVLPGKKLERLNGDIEKGEVRYVSGETVDRILEAGLITEDGKVIYRIDDDIPVMLEDMGIGTTQFENW